MALSKKIFPKVEAAAGNGGAAASAEQNLILNLDANDVDSYDGDGSIWYDISEHDLTVPLSDNADDLELHLNASDSTSYNPTSGTTTWSDISGNSRDATMTSMGNSNFDIDNGGYFEFDGSNDYMTISNDTSFASATNWSVGMWLNPISIGSDEMLATLYGSSSDQKFDIRFSNSSGNIRFVAGTSSGTFSSSQDLSSSTALSTATWHHIVCVYDDTNDKMYIYIDGELDATKTGASSGTYTSITDPILIGKRTDGYHSNIKLGAFRFYSKALSASEIGQNYRHGRDYIYTDLVDDTNLELHFDAADLTSASNTTWTDKASSLDLTKSGSVGFDDELGNFVDFTGGYYGNDAATNTIKDANADYSLEFWFNWDSQSGSNAILGAMQDSSFRGFFVYYDSSTLDLYNYKDGTHSGAQFSSTSFATLGITTGIWYHICFVVDSSTNIKVFVDGELKDTSTSNAGGTHWTSIDGIRLGAVETLAYGNDGKLGQTRIYRGKLSDDEVMQNYLFTQNNYPNEFHLDGTNMTSADWDSNGYFDFDGSSEYFYKNDYPVDFGTSDYTIIMWFNSDTNNASKALFSTYNSNGLMINLQSNGTIRHYHDGGTLLQYYTSETISTGTWYQLAVTFDRSNDTGSMYLSTKSTFDSTASTGTASSGATNKGDGGTNVGRYNNGFQFDGRIANVRVYDKALSSSEIEAVWNTDKGNIPT